MKHRRQNLDIIVHKQHLHLVKQVTEISYVTWFLPAQCHWHDKLNRTYGTISI